MQKILLLTLVLIVSCNKSGGGSSSQETSSTTTPAPINSCEVAAGDSGTPIRLKGLKPITSSEMAQMKKISAIRPNQIGLKRINDHRKANGLTSMTEEQVSEDFGGALPTSLDNSTMSSFPPIGQQSVNNCVGWAFGYYQWTHNNGLALNLDNKSSAANRCSPKFLYNMINDGVDNGAYFSDALNMLAKHGCISMANFPEDGDYRTWDTNPAHWQAAIPFRASAYQYISNVDTDAGLSQVKQLLNNGYVLTYGTYIDSWQFTTIKANPSSALNPLAGKNVLLYMNGTNGGHAMTIVGYDDTAWTDINSNNVVDAGELGVFKVANSWGTNWMNGGYIFVAYDALKSVSGVSGGPSAGRQPVFMSKAVYHLPVKSSNGTAYAPKYLAKFTVSNAARNQISVKFGSSSSTYTPFALMNKGGANNFSGTVVMDVSDLTVSADNNFSLTVSDNTSGNATTVSSFEIIDLVHSTQAASQELLSAVNVDGGSKTFNVNTSTTVANAAPTARMSASVISGIAPLEVQFDASGTTDPDGTIASYNWNFGDGTTATGITPSKTFNRAGQFTVTLTVKDNDGATATATKTISVNVETTTPPATCN